MAVPDRVCAWHAGDARRVATCFHAAQPLEHHPQILTRLWAARRHAELDERPILRIVGPPTDGHGCGKTYTSELLDHVASSRTDLNLVTVRVPEGLAASFPVEALATPLIAPTHTP